MGKCTCLPTRWLSVGVAASLTIGCVSLPRQDGDQGSPTSSAAEQRYDQESGWLAKTFGRTDVQAAALGGIAVTGGCLLANKSLAECLLAGAVGAGVGYAVGSAMNSNRAQHAQTEMTLDQALVAVRQDNANAQKMVAAQDAVINEKMEELKRIQQGVRRKTLSLADARQQLAAVEKTKAHLAEKTKALAAREQDWSAVGKRNDNPQLNEQIGAMRSQLQAADKKLEVLKKAYDETSSDINTTG